MPQPRSGSPHARPTAAVRPLTAVGVTCGIGSMLVGARQAGFEVVGNVEWRRYYHRADADGRSTFAANFPGAFMVQHYEDLGADDLDRATGVDLALGHPECGCYSQLNSMNHSRVQKKFHEDPGDIPLFVQLVGRLGPRYFAMDDLPKSFIAFPMAEYARLLPDYDLFPEWVSNAGYGNVQKNRKRMFMIGSLKSERWAFVPGEVVHARTLRDEIGDLIGREGEVPNHDPHVLDERCQRGLSMDYEGHRPTWAEVRDWVAGRPEGATFKYYAKDGTLKTKPGMAKNRWDGHAFVLDGASPQFHPVTNLPLTVRERARVQGFPDDFVFYGVKLNDRGEWNHERNNDIVKQTGKAMPVQFNRYVSELVRAGVEGRAYPGATGVRLLTPNPFVDDAKRWYCREVGYADQPRACAACWMKGTCDIRRGKYGIPDDAVGAAPAAPTAVSRGPRPRRRSLGQVPPPAPVADDPVAVTSLFGDDSASAGDPPPPPAPVEVVRLGDPKRRAPAVHVEPVNVVPGPAPADYHCRCHYCLGPRVLGELRRADGSYYSRLDRRRYYHPSEHGPGGHLAKTPPHVARWLVQQFTLPGDWVLDPTAGAGTTLVEALVQGRCAAGVELQYGAVLGANAGLYAAGGRRAVLGLGDARGVRGFLADAGVASYALVVNNPPYSGDQSDVLPGNPRRGDYRYDDSLPNLALLREGNEYWRTLADVYRGCVEFLAPGGYFGVAVKDQMRKKEPDYLHRRMGDTLASLGLLYHATVFLRHYPGTLHLHTYERRTGVRPPLYQTVLVFRKPSTAPG